MRASQDLEEIRFQVHSRPEGRTPGCDYVHQLEGNGPERFCKSINKDFLFFSQLRETIPTRL